MAQAATTRTTKERRIVRIGEERVGGSLLCLLCALFVCHMTLTIRNEPKHAGGSPGCPLSRQPMRMRMGMVTSITKFNLEKSSNSCRQTTTYKQNTQTNKQTNKHISCHVMVMVFPCVHALFSPWDREC